MSTTAPDTSWQDKGLLPTAVSSRIVESAIRQSVVLRLATRQAMPTGTETVPIVAIAPQAGWVGTPGGRKPIAKIEWSAEVLKAEEVAAVTAIPDLYLTDTRGSWDVEGSAEAELAKAVARSLDAAVLFGVDAPASFPPGGIAAFAAGPVSGATAPEAISAAMGELEGEGILPDGIVGGASISQALRAAALEAGEIAGAPAGEIFGVPVAVTAPWPSTAPNAYIGGWQFVLVGVREDVTFGISKDGVLVDDAGEIVVSAFQDNMTLVKIFARFGLAIARPLTADGTEPSTPIVGAEWSATDGAAPAASEVRAQKAQSQRKAA